MSVRTRFAPSPTGHVHIGNMRAAIYNWLYARHCGGQFLLRVEDTDRERSTQEATDTLLEAMRWLGMESDEPVFYQSQQRETHLAAAERLLDQGLAYRAVKGEGGEAVLFRMPWDCGSVPGVRTVGPAEYTVHPEVPVQVSFQGVRFAGVSKKGAPVEQECALAGLKDMQLHGPDGTVLFALNETIAEVLAGTTCFEVPGAVRMTFTRREIGFDDQVKGRLAKPLDSMKDLVIVRSDGNPVFHLANVCDDIAQGVTHIIRGDDHVENTYRHLFLFHGLGGTVPVYAHLPMVVNAQGKPYSKRDGDAFVGDFREKGYLPEALFNYLVLLGWAPEGGRERLTREELAAEFDLARVKSSPAQMDLKKLDWLNGEYFRAQPVAERLQQVRAFLPEATEPLLELLAERLTRAGDAAQYGYLVRDTFAFDEKAVQKRLLKAGAFEVLDRVAETLRGVEPFVVDRVDAALHEFVEASGLGFGAVMPLLRVAVSGQASGPDLAPMLAWLGRDRVLARLQAARLRFESVDG